MMRRKKARRAIRRVGERRDVTVRVDERDTVVSTIAYTDDVWRVCLLVL